MVTAGTAKRGRRKGRAKQIDGSVRSGGREKTVDGATRGGSEAAEDDEEDDEGGEGMVENGEVGDKAAEKKKLA